MLHLFMSYSTGDAERARSLAKDLRRSMIDPWMDDELRLSGRWNDEIENRIKSCRFFVMCLSQATQGSNTDRFFRKELSLAFEMKRPILPVRFEECELPTQLPLEVAKQISRLQREDLFPAYYEGLQRILRFLHTDLRSGVFEETFSCLGADNADWRFDGWRLDDADSTGENSQSLYGTVRLTPEEMLPQTRREVASIDIDLPAGSRTLRYRRRLKLSAPIGGEAQFQFVVDGEFVDAASQANSDEEDWTTCSVTVPDRGERRAMLELKIWVSSAMNYFPSAEVWIDDIRIS